MFVVGADVLPEAATLVLDGIEPGDGLPDRLVAGLEAERLERRDDRGGAVDVVDAPAAPPRAVGLLLAQEVVRPARDGVSEAGDRRQRLERVRGDVFARRVDDGAEIKERDLVEPVARVVDVERAPAAVRG